ncbi:MAG: hypothetical protein EOM80_13275 [Erysipelotrichia bacterium]|nr:hypothetical protein [Erysipelotrichia bacterium]
MRNISMLLLFLLIVNCLSSVTAAEIRIFKLRYASPCSVERVCESLFAGQASFAAAPQINALVVNSDDNALFAEVEKLVLALDCKPAMLNFTVKSLADSKENAQKLKIQSNSLSGITTKNTSSSHSERSITVLEFARARFTDDQIRVYSVPAIYGKESIALTTSHGLKISGHVSDDGRVWVQVWYAEDAADETETLLTELEVEPGCWNEFGGLQQGAKERDISQSFGRISGLRQKSFGCRIARRFAIKVDVVK